MADQFKKSRTMTDHCNRRSALIGLCPLCPEIARSYRSRDFGAQKSSGHKLTQKSRQLPPGCKAVTKRLRK